MFALVILSNAPLLAQAVLTEERTAESFQRAVLLPQSVFHKERILDLSREFLAEQKDTLLARLFMVTDERATAGIFGIRQQERSYLDFALEYLSNDWYWWGMAEVMRIGKDAVLRVRYPDRSLERTVLQGGDPLRLRLKGGEAEVLYVAVPMGIPEDRHWDRADFYVLTSGKLSKDHCEEIALELKRRTQVVAGFVAIRNDPWFTESPFMPVRYQFWEDWRFPDPVTFIETPTAYSGWDERQALIPYSLMYHARCPRNCAGPVARE